MTIADPPIASLSLVRGPPLDHEPGLGALTIAGYAREITQRFADREALVMQAREGRISWTYSDLWDRSFEVAKALIAAGVGKDCRVGILMTNRPEFLSAMFGVALAGGVTVALSTFSTPFELEHLLQASQLSVLLYDRQVLTKDFGAMLAELEPAMATAAPGTLSSAKFPYLRRLVVLDTVAPGPDPAALDAAAVEQWEDFVASGAEVDPAIVTARASATSPSDMGVIFFSSGTTSTPKGILHAQRALPVQWWRWPRIFDVDPFKFPVRAWTGNGFFWSGNISLIVGNALTSGGTIVLQPLFDADQAIALFETERVSLLSGRPHQWARLAASDRWAGADFSSLHYITYDDTLGSHPSVKTDWKLNQAFGTTETLTIVTATVANRRDEPQGSYGNVLPGNVVKIIDPHTGAIQPRGARGEIGVKGPTLMIGYVGKAAELTFDDEGYFLTGDGGYVDEDGRLFWEGRLTEIIKTGGANVSPQEVDSVIANYLGVKRTQTVGVPHDTLGEMVVSCIVPHEGVTIDITAIRAFLKERLASFKIPREILFFEEPELAVTGSGKVKFEALRDLAVRRLAQNNG